MKVLAFEIASGHSADVVLVPNAVSHKKIADGTYLVTFKHTDGLLYDIVVKNVVKVSNSTLRGGVN